ncbi:MAG: flavodoxin domain-containing protein [bacterium]|nr:flavodoxin domain-containing protein [bacterium]MDY4100355.1 flavodoxin domain-containing protein [Lachnospiraceae bacterium]
MKTMIIYNSQTGFTAQYAQWIADATGADRMELKEAKKKDLKYFDSYDKIVYGAWVMGGTVSKLQWFEQYLNAWKRKHLAVFAVGASPEDSETVAEFLKKTFTGEQWKGVAHFYCQGGLNYEHMSMPNKMLMKMLKKTLDGKKDKTPQEEEMAKMIGSSYDISDRKYAEPVIEWIQGSCA